MIVMTCPLLSVDSARGNVSLVQEDHVLAPDRPRSRLQLGSVDGVGSCERFLWLDRVPSAVLCRHLVDALLRHRLRAPGLYSLIVFLLVYWYEGGRFPWLPISWQFGRNGLSRAPVLLSFVEFTFRWSLEHANSAEVLAYLSTFRTPSVVYGETPT
jgi:hypothetical protein